MCDTKENLTLDGLSETGTTRGLVKIPFHTLPSIWASFLIECPLLNMFVLEAPLFQLTSLIPAHSNTRPHLRQPVPPLSMTVSSEFIEFVVYFPSKQLQAYPHYKTTILVI